ncbi:hypothetical protein SK128_009999 [Halocaridina rubra]|uniref:Uncharacterized protein n=1 Tax=Halocaridina rubra TaxID=373956 RepID=A0AAN9ACF2_HALRR
MRRRFPVANHTSVRSATIFEQFAPEHFETIVINATPLAVLDICEVCGSYQCSYCPTYSTGTSSLASVVIIIMSFITGISLSNLSLQEETNLFVGIGASDVLLETTDHENTVTFVDSIIAMVYSPAQQTGI